MIFFYPIFSVSASIEQKNLFVYFWSCSLSWHLFLSRPISLSPLQSLSKYFGLGSLKFYPKISSSCPKCTQYWLRFSTLYFSRCAEKEELVTLTGVVGGDLVNRESDKLPQPFDREKMDREKMGWEKIGKFIVMTCLHFRNSDNSRPLKLCFPWLYLSYTFAQNSPFHILRNDRMKCPRKKLYARWFFVEYWDSFFYIANVLESFGGEWRLFLIWFKTFNLTKDKDKNSKSTWETKSNHQSCSQKVL